MVIIKKEEKKERSCRANTDQQGYYYINQFNNVDINSGDQIGSINEEN